MVVGKQYAVKDKKGFTIEGLELVYSSRFKNNIWVFLREDPKMSFERYREKAKDFNCFREAFDDVVKDMQLFCVWDEIRGRMVPKQKKTIVTVIAQEPPPLPPVAEQPIIMVPEPTPVIESPVSSVSTEPSKRKRLDKELKLLAVDWMIKNPLASYIDFQDEFKWPEFTKSNYYMLRGRLKDTGMINVAPVANDKKTSIVAKPALAPVANDTRSNSIFRTGPKALFTAEVMASVDLSKYKPESYKDIRDAMMDYFNSRADATQKTNPFQALLITDPPTLEVRRKIL